MIVYRGPKATNLYNLYDPYAPLIKGVHEEVDTIDLSKITSSWTNEKRITINVSKNAKERKSVVNIFLTEDDVIALYRGLVDGWREELKKRSEQNGEY